MSISLWEDPVVTAKFEITAGALHRRAVQNTVQKECDRNGLELKVREYKGFLASDFVFEITGQYEKVQMTLNYLSFVFSQHHPLGKTSSLLFAESPESF